MKVPPRSYRLLWDAHAWAGALASVLLVSMFLLGVISLFHDELAPWQEPHLRTSVVADESKVLATIQRAVEVRAIAGAPTRIDVDLPAPHTPWIRLEAHAKDGVRTAEWLDPVTGAARPEGSDLGHFLFLMHFLYPLPGGMLLAGLLAAILLLVVATGLFLQLGRFRRELVKFRPAAALRTVWGDLHKVLGSVGVPFQAMIAWTAAIVCLNAMVLQPVVVHSAFDGDLDAGLASIGYPRGPKRANEPGSAPELAAALASTRRAVPDADHVRLTVRNPGDASVHVDVRGRAGDGLNAFTTVRVAGDGRVLHVRDAGGPTMASRVIEGSYVLHAGMYGGLGLKLVYALLGLFSAFCVVTGNLVWLERRARSERRFDVLLARLTAGGCGAAASSIAAILLANQLLPEALPDRPFWEHFAFYAGWIIALIVALLHPRPATSTLLLLGGAGATLLALPFLDAGRHARIPFDPSANPHVFGAELALAATGALFLVSAWIIRRLTRVDASEAAPVPYPHAA